MKTFIIILTNAKYNFMVINATNEDEARNIATSKDIKVNPLYSIDEKYISDIIQVEQQTPGILFYE